MSKYRDLSSKEKEIIENKNTELPFSGKYVNHWLKGTYHCKKCDQALYESGSKFNAQCGWPSFDDEIKGSITRIPDPDGIRTEIVCSNCQAHLGHVFLDEGFTPQNTRHCVNSISLIFKESKNSKVEYAVLGAGCFWGVEHYMKTINGVIDTMVGYSGGLTKDPDYQTVCSDTTDHAEVIKVVYNPQKTSYIEILKMFFEIHNFSQIDRQGPDIGRQYRSIILYTNEKQYKESKKIMKLLQDKGYQVATELQKLEVFYPAEKYHQNYYEKTGKTPYCHFKRKIFE